MISELEKLRSDLWGNGQLPKKELQESKHLRQSFVALSRTINYLKYLKMKKNEKTTEKKTEIEKA